MLAILVALLVWTGPKGQVDHVDFLGAGDYPAGCELIATKGATARAAELKADLAAGLTGRLVCVVVPEPGTKPSSL